MSGAGFRSNALVPELAVTDWSASRRFYSELIGFAVAYERPEEGFSYLVLGDAHLMIDEIGQGRTFAIDGVLMERPLGRGLNLQLLVPDVSAILQRLEAKGIAPYLALEERWYRRGEVEVGNRQFVVADPDGYLIRCFEDLGERHRGPDS